ncbi:hypothetical protein [Phenylobacterium sp.]|uniref:hypothetical protein n=1 Tax=Phenylobacterium sp. TaxID=1871053 RepID=UPI00121BF762|nr:hypothetical protein [Phenylobacterium sp.]THD50564.1 MAG: hypothetical protein E8A12_22340 [Phenylobacterium sp.]
MAGVLRRAVLGGLAAGASLGAGAGAARARVPRPADLEGVWTLGTYTDLERPPALHALVLTPAEAEAYEAPRRRLGGMPVPNADDVLGQAETERSERGDGLARVRGQIRSSWIVDPPDGRIPFTAEGLAAVARARTEQFANPEGLSGTTRCLANAAAGAPMSGGPDANLFQLVQTPDAVVIVSEKYHEVRIIRMGAAARGPVQPPQWTGDGVGHWEGASLVAETRGGHPGAILRGGRLMAVETSRVTERFTRTARDELIYEFTVEDPVLYARAWRGEMALRPAPGRMFEFACHEGNYSLPGILAGARLEEREAAAKGGK